MLEVGEQLIVAKVSLCSALWNVLSFFNCCTKCFLLKEVGRLLDFLSMAYADLTVILHVRESSSTCWTATYTCIVCSASGLTHWRGILCSIGWSRSILSALLLSQCLMEVNMSVTDLALLAKWLWIRCLLQILGDWLFYARFLFANPMHLRAYALSCRLNPWINHWHEWLCL